MKEFVMKMSGCVWGVPILLLLGFGGAAVSLTTGFVQIRLLPASLRSAFGGMFRSEGRSEGTVTPFEAVCTALGGTVGTGNITGVAAALAVGGPGSVFWMWVSALLGMGTKFAEIVLAVKYRERGENGEVRGGPMYYIKNGLGKRWRWLASAFSLCGALAAFGIGNLAQAGSIADGVGAAFGAVMPGVIGDGTVPLLVGFLLSAAMALSLSGGTGGRARTVSVLVPLMAALYILGSAAVIGAHIDAVPGVLADIMRSAFTTDAAVGGTLGSAIAWGFRRGMLSHEAGMGSSPIAHGSANAKSPSEQGLLGIFEVFFDTIVICTLTALMLLCSGVEITGSAACCGEALAGVFGREVSAVFLAVSLSLFAFSSMLGWSMYGERCAEYILGDRAAVPYRCLFVLAALFAPMAELPTAIAAADVLNAFMAVPNMTAVLLLLPVVKREVRGHAERS